MTSFKMTDQRQKGFTLVELAIVMIIIGLLIGGILKGQELIGNAQVTSTVAQMKGIDAAASTFRDSYNALAGDFANATGANAKLATCVAPCQNGDGDGRLDVNVGAAPALAANEGVAFFNQLRAANLLGGFDGTAVLAFGQALPTASIGGGYTAGDSRNGVTYFTAAELRSGVYIVLTGGPAVAAAGTGIATTAQAARIDRKMDDGRSNSGIVISDPAAACRQNTNEYNEANTTQVCNIAVRIQG